MITIWIFRQHLRINRQSLLDICKVKIKSSLSMQELKWILMRISFLMSSLYVKLVMNMVSMWGRHPILLMIAIHCPIQVWQNHMRRIFITTILRRSHLQFLPTLWKKAIWISMMRLDLTVKISLHLVSMDVLRHKQSEQICPSIRRHFTMCSPCLMRKMLKYCDWHLPWTRKLILVIQSQESIISL